jgi:hypothetical protein
MLSKEIIGNHGEKNTEHCGQNVEFFIVSQLVHIVTTVF